MELHEALKELEELADEKMRVQNVRHAAKQGIAEIRQFGVRMGEIRKLAKKIKSNHDLALELWPTGYIEARQLACLIVKPKLLTADELDQWVRSEQFWWVADWLNSYVVKQHPDKETLRQKWMESDNNMAARAGWNLTAQRVVKSPEGLNIPELLDRIEAEMGDADPAAQWTMNMALVEIGINHPDLRARAIAIGEKLGVFSDYPVSKGCTSPFAPIWIGEMVKRQG